MVSQLGSVVAAAPSSRVDLGRKVGRVVPRRPSGLRSLRFLLSRQAPQTTEPTRLLTLVRCGIALEELSTPAIRRSRLIGRRFALALAVARGRDTLILDRMLDRLTTSDAQALLTTLARLYDDGIAIYVICSSAFEARFVAQRLATPRWRQHPMVTTADK